MGSMQTVSYKMRSYLFLFSWVVWSSWVLARFRREEFQCPVSLVSQSLQVLVRRLRHRQYHSKVLQMQCGAKESVFRRGHDICSSLDLITKSELVKNLFEVQHVFMRFSSTSVSDC